MTFICKYEIHVFVGSLNKRRIKRKEIFVLKFTGNWYF